MAISAEILALLQQDWRFTIAASLVTYVIGLATYRLFFHPLAGVPGPKLAALTSWWEVYYQVWIPAQMEFRLLELHKQYGKSSNVEPPMTDST
jgi:hypothetical protein